MTALRVARLLAAITICALLIYVSAYADELTVPAKVVATGTYALDTPTQRLGTADGRTLVAFGFLSGVGHLMGPPAGATGGTPPTPTYRILTLSGQTIKTLSGAPIRTIQSTP